MAMGESMAVQMLCWTLLGAGLALEPAALLDDGDVVGVVVDRGDAEHGVAARGHDEGANHFCLRPGHDGRLLPRGAQDELL